MYNTVINIYIPYNVITSPSLVMTCHHANLPQCYSLYSPLPFHPSVYLSPVVTISLIFISMTLFSFCFVCSFVWYELTGVSNLWPRMAANVAQHKIINLLKTFFFAHQFSLVFVYLMGGPRQLFFFQCGPEAPKGCIPDTLNSSF